MSGWKIVAAAGLVLTVGCNLAPQRMPDNSYYAQSQSWVDDRGAPVQPAAPSTVGRSPTPSATQSGWKEPSPSGSSALEELQVARRDVARQDSELLQARETIQSLTLTVDQLRQDNAKMKTACDALEAECETYRGAAGDREGDVADLERQLRQLADELLIERIARLRVERDLLLGKIDPLVAAGEDG